MFFESLVWSVCLAIVTLASPSPQGRPQGPPSQGPPGGAGGGIPNGPTSPEYTWLFEYPLPIPTVAQPIYTSDVNGSKINFYELTLEDFEHQVYPNLGPAHLTGYNGSCPGPTFQIQKGTESIVRVLNKGSGPAAMHLHGSPSRAPWDGWASDLIQPGQFKDYFYPNSQAGPLWYHDHVDSITAPDVYYGQAGVYIIYDPLEDALGLPTGSHDIPLALNDKVYQSNGDLASPDGNPINFFGDIIQVSEQPWPYFEVEPRQYRLRFFDMSLSRAFNLYFAGDDGKQIEFQIIASDAGLFAYPVASSEIKISMGERWEIVVDFSSVKGSNITLMNNMANEEIPDFPNTDKLMRFVVGDTVTDAANNGPVPSKLNSVAFPPARATVDHVFNFQHGGDDIWTINGESFNDVNNRVLARPEQGTVELWELNYAGGPGIHPVHIHLVNFQIVSRSGGQRGDVMPYEAAGLKDVVLLAPGESVRVLAVYGPWNGQYMFHCHNLIHEDHLMMDVFNVTRLEELGYPLSETQNFDNPVDPRYVAQGYNDAAYAPDAISSTISVLGNLAAYGQAASLNAAFSSYYATAGFPTESATPAPAAPTGGAGGGGRGSQGGPPRRLRRAPGAMPAPTPRWIA